MQRSPDNALWLRFRNALNKGWAGIQAVDGMTLYFGVGLTLATLIGILGLFLVTGLR
jgi:hypothetical protein